MLLFRFKMKGFVQESDTSDNYYKINFALSLSAQSYENHQPNNFANFKFVNLESFIDKNCKNVCVCAFTKQLPPTAQARDIQIYYKYVT